MVSRLALMFLGISYATAMSMLGEEPMCKIDKDFKMLQTLASLESRINVLEHRKPTCPDGWIFFQNQCFMFEDELSVTFTRAKEFCSSLGAKLPIITNSEMDTFLTTFNGKLFKGISHVGTWFGAEDLERDGIWFWGRYGKKVRDGFSNWMSGEGDENMDHIESCGCFWKDEGTFGWHDCKCDLKLHIICQKTIEI